MLINLEALNQLFMDSPAPSRLTYDGSCRKCGRDFKIEIDHHASGGYGLAGGVLYMQEADRITAKCEACYLANPELEA
ncbi:hypothetical protein JY97_03810 [Alkalispirochaeta odontotermitis]|nr:hypothetical protein JY97_03810 [Alkalispirochaeta odontotermitis]CAB1076759.1 hypothetical protein D1AOALGA4SA_4557 [Olavius algarvensis Delta 1 endosymbiont]